MNFSFRGSESVKERKNLLIIFLFVEKSQAKTSFKCQCWNSRRDKNVCKTASPFILSLNASWCKKCAEIVEFITKKIKLYRNYIMSEKSNKFLLKESLAKWRFDTKNASYFFKKGNTYICQRWEGIIIYILFLNHLI